MYDRFVLKLYKDSDNERKQVLLDFPSASESYAKLLRFSHSGKKMQEKLQFFVFIRRLKSATPDYISAKNNLKKLYKIMLVIFRKIKLKIRENCSKMVKI